MTPETGFPILDRRAFLGMGLATDLSTDRSVAATVLPAEVNIAAAVVSCSRLLSKWPIWPSASPNRR